MSSNKMFSLTPNEHKRLDLMLEFFGGKDLDVRISFNYTATVEVLDREGHVLASGKGFILIDAMDDLITTLNKIGFF